MSEPIRLTRLPSGLTVVTERMERVETVSFGAYVATGSRHETAAENGVSHFLEHMAFKGTERRSAAEIAEEIEAVGGHLNAYTAREQTAYYAKVLKEDTALAADIIGDILTHSTFEPEELERERGVILQEIGQANDTPDDIIFDRFQEAAYPTQPLGRPVLGTEEGIREMPRGVLTGYMRRHYAASNVVIAGAGALQHDQVLDLVATHFADLAADPAPAASAGRYHGGEFREARDLDQVHIVLGFPSVAYGDPDYYPTLLLSTLLGGGMSSRLFQEVREKRGLVYSIYSFSAPVHGWRAVRHLCRHRRERGGGADAGHAGGTAQGAARGDRGRTGPRPGAGEGQPADVAGKHRQPLRAACAPDPGVRPGDPDPGDGGEDQRGHHRRRAAGGRATFPRDPDAGRAGAE